MKKTILLAALSVILTQLTIAQNIQFTPVAGYSFCDKFHFYQGNAKIGDGFTYGGYLSFGINRHVALELSYIRQDCDAYAYSDYHNISLNEPISSNYILLGASKLFSMSEEMTLFTGGGFGMGIYSGKTAEIGSITKFAVGLNGGMKYLFTDVFGIRLQANLFFPVTDLSGSLWWGPGGTSVGVSSRIPFVQFGFTGGFIFNIN